MVLIRCKTIDQFDSEKYVYLLLGHLPHNFSDVLTELGSFFMPFTEADKVKGFLLHLFIQVWSFDLQTVVITIYYYDKDNSFCNFRKLPHQFFYKKMLTIILNILKVLGH